MMDDSTCVAHTCSCQNGTGSIHSIQPPRRVWRGASLEIVAVQGKKAASFPIREFLIKQLRILHKNPACLNRHWAVQVNRKGLHLLLAKQDGEVIQNLLRTPDRKCRYQHLPIIP